MHKHIRIEDQQLNLKNNIMVLDFFKQNSIVNTLKIFLLEHTYKIY